MIIIFNEYYGRLMSRSRVQFAVELIYETTLSKLTLVWVVPAEMILNLRRDNWCNCLKKYFGDEKHWLYKKEFCIRIPMSNSFMAMKVVIKYFRNILKSLQISH